MKILVIDDTKLHLKAALQTLAGHDVTVCDNHDEALKLLYPKRDEEKFKRLYTCYEQSGETSAYKKADFEARLPYWDAVLCDLLMPAGRNAQGGEGSKLVGQEMAVGWSLALQAVKNGAKFVAVVTDMNHHSHPASAMLDALNGHVFAVDEAKMLMTNRVSMIGIIGTECKCTDCGGTGKKNYSDGTEYACYSCKNGTDFSEKGKDWSRILAYILGTCKEE